MAPTPRKATRGTAHPAAHSVLRLCIAAALLRGARLGARVAALEQNVVQCAPPRPGHIVLLGAWQSNDGGAGGIDHDSFARSLSAADQRRRRKCTWKKKHYRWNSSQAPAPQRAAAPLMAAPELRAALPPNTRLMFLGDSLSLQFADSYNLRPCPTTRAGVNSKCTNGPDAVYRTWRVHAFAPVEFRSSNPRVQPCVHDFRSNKKKHVQKSTEHDDAATFEEALLHEKNSTHVDAVHNAVIVVNQAAHLHRPADRLGACYAKHDASATPTAALVAAQSDLLAWWRREVERQARHLSRFCARAKEVHNVTVRVFYRTSPPAADIWVRNTRVENRPTTPLPPDADLAEAYKSPGTRDGIEYSHNLFGAINDMSTAAYLAAGHGVIDVEHMLGVRVDAHPASGTQGHGDALHFCAPGPVDFAVDAVVRALWPAGCPWRPQSN